MQQDKSSEYTTWECATYRNYLYSPVVLKVQMYQITTGLPVFLSQGSDSEALVIAPHFFTVTHIKVHT